MCYTMAYLSAHYSALLDIGWDFGAVQQLFFFSNVRFYLPACIVFARTRDFSHVPEP